jgi:hypothetical protein
MWLVMNSMKNKTLNSAQTTAKSAVRKIIETTENGKTLQFVFIRRAFIFEETETSICKLRALHPPPATQAGERT